MVTSWCREGYSFQMYSLRVFTEAISGTCIRISCLPCTCVSIYTLTALFLRWELNPHACLERPVLYRMCLPMPLRTNFHHSEWTHRESNPDCLRAKQACSHYHYGPMEPNLVRRWILQCTHGRLVVKLSLALCVVLSHLACPRRPPRIQTSRHRGIEPLTVGFGGQPVPST